MQIYIAKRILFNAILGVQRLRRAAGGRDDDQQRPLRHLHHRARTGHGIPEGIL